MTWNHVLFGRGLELEQRSVFALSLREELPLSGEDLLLEHFDLELFENVFYLQMGLRDGLFELHLQDSEVVIIAGGLVQDFEQDFSFSIE